MDTIKNRIKRHVQVKASELVPHELDPRTHPEHQRQALQALLEEIGFARSLLAYELPDGRLKLIDGHLRQEMQPDLIVEVEVLDVNDAEARALLLSMDPLAQLAEVDARALDELRRVTQTDNAMLQAFWANLQSKDRKSNKELERTKNDEAPEQFLVLIECGDEQEQTDLLRRFSEEGLKCRALLG